jgi:hypothetical protein
MLEIQAHLIIMDKHVRKMLHTSIANRLRFGLLGITIMRGKTDLRWIIQSNVTGNSLYNIIVCVKL